MAAELIHALAEETCTANRQLQLCNDCIITVTHTSTQHCIY